MNNLSEIDPNFKVDSDINKDDVVFHNVLSAPMKVYGVFYEDGKFRRMPESVAQKVTPGVLRLHSNTAGGRVRFQTDSPYIAIRTSISNSSKVVRFAMTGSQGFDLYCRENGEEVYRGTYQPPEKDVDVFERVLNVGEKEMREITVNFPLYSDVHELYIGLAEDAVLSAPRPYKYEKPVVYYGSSITQGGCACRPGTSYQAFLTRWLDCDHVNLGFSGNARAEDPMIEYIKNLDMSVFVYDYDHNATTAEYLEATHEKMFRAVREAQPDLPIIMMSRPRLRLSDLEIYRMQIIKNTYDRAVAAGDKRVWFIPGPELMALAGHDGTVDNSHPTDLGFMSMAKAVEKVLRPILESLN